YQCDLGLTLSHEGGHIKNFVQKFKDYIKWLTNAPAVYNNMADHNGHDYGDPTGAEAIHQEQEYRNNKNKYGR
ncbi:MAG: hypothetical protein PHI52_07200, partial [Bacteroidales bacterium]|nr:hypothetical protein [Bacteroidales bacterium]